MAFKIIKKLQSLLISFFESQYDTRKFLDDCREREEDC